MNCSKQTYTDWSTTPLKFYNFLHTALPILCFLNILGIILYFIQYYQYAASFVFWIDVVLRLASTVLMGVSASLLDKRQWNCIISIFLQFLLLAVRNEINNFFSNASFGTYIGALIGSLLWFVPIYVYFKKRRFLFYPIPVSLPIEVYKKQESQSKQFTADKSTAEVVNGNPSPEPQPVVLTYKSDFKLPEPPKQELSEVNASSKAAEPKRTSKKNQVICLMLAVLCIASLVGNTVQFYHTSKLQSSFQAEVDSLAKDLELEKKTVEKLDATRTALRQKNKDLETVNDNLRDKVQEYLGGYNFLCGNIGFIVDGSKYYHNYNCKMFQAADSFWAHNIEYCRYLGYSKCPVCNGEDYDSDSKPIFKKIS